VRYIDKLVDIDVLVDTVGIDMLGIDMLESAEMLEIIFFVNFRLNEIFFCSFLIFCRRKNRYVQTFVTVTFSSCSKLA
jgi:hypothetical protein